MKNIIGIFDLKDTTQFVQMEGFIRCPDYKDYNLDILSPWEYGAFKIGDTFMRVLVCACHKDMLQHLDDILHPSKIATSMGR